MSQDTENFDSLRRLLAIKRHEIPPPGYYDSFSHEVIVRIKAGERGEDSYGYVWQMGWLQRLWSAFEARPALAGALGLAMCSLVVFGVVSADNAPLNMPALSGVTATDEQPSGMRIADNGFSGSALSAQPVLADGDSNPIHMISSKGTQTSLFDLVPNARADQSSLSLAVPQ